MGSKNLQRVMFQELADARMMLTLLTANIEAMRRASNTMAGIYPLNHPAMNEARRDARHALELLSEVYSEFLRLHSQCTEAECSLTEGDVEESKAEVAMIIELIDDEARQADKLPPLPDNGSHDLLSRIADAIGVTLEPLKSDLPQRKTRNDTLEQGTGYYL